MLKLRRNGEFNLAFLDVMACGLGAVLLILIIVNFQDDTPIPSSEIERLEQELQSLQSQMEQAQALAESAKEQKEQLNDASVQEAKNVQSLIVTKLSLQQQIAEKKAVIAQLQDAIAAMAPIEADDSIDLPEVSEEQYLLGLTVEGKQIGILVDASASMTDQELIQIIKRKLGSDKQKQAGPKWQRTKRILKWLIARIPEQSRVTLLAYNESAEMIGPNAIINARSSKALKSLLTDIESIVPHTGTNLLKGLQEISRLNPNMTDLYIITDGLPSLLPNTSGFSGSRNCKPFKGQQKTITGECRSELMQWTMRMNPLSGVKTNIVLLPLEGDPQAPAHYWQWSNFTGGTFIQPAPTWP